MRHGLESHKFRSSTFRLNVDQTLFDMLSLVSNPTILCFLVYATASACQNVLSAESSDTWSIGSGFEVVKSSNDLSISHHGAAIWSTIPGSTFISASAGNDSILESSGAFNITQVDVDICQGQNISDVRNVAWDRTVTGSGIQITGFLLGCGDSTPPYTLTFWVPSSLTDRVAFYLDVSSASGLANPLKKLYFRFASRSAEDFYGLGAQASFASLKNQSVPIFSREQGVGRGDQPLTQYENENGTFSGGNRFTTYTAIPSYVSTDGNVFYLSEKSTGYANFDFTESDAVTVRYDSLSVDGMFMQASNMFEAVEMLTAYTGRMPRLPYWVDTGAVLGIQGGQAKVNNIVEQGLELGCPIAAVWLQDWCGTRTYRHCHLSFTTLTILKTHRRVLTSTYHDCGGIGRTTRICIRLGTSSSKTYVPSTMYAPCPTSTRSSRTYLRNLTDTAETFTMKRTLSTILSRTPPRILQPRSRVDQV